MKYLFNLVKHSNKLGLFDDSWLDVRRFIMENKLQGIEIMFYYNYDIKDIPKEIVHGIHMLYWPTWIDFWKGNKKELLKQFENEENIEMYYGGLSKDILKEHYLKEIQVAKELNVDYMVFHVSHVQLEHIYRWDFSYEDQEIMEHAADLINDVFGNEDKGITLLFENLWWPGLNFNNPQLTENFLNKIDYPNKGFMLDIGHLMITNSNIRNLDEACEYILEVLEKHKGIISYIQGIHLNQSLTGKYLNESHEDKLFAMKDKKIWDNLSDARNHISKIDTHVPFENCGIKEIINIVQPKYLVYEFLPKDLDELNLMVKLQNNILNR